MAEICLVCEEKIAFYSPQAVVEVHGERVNIHFDCLSFFNRNPEKYGGVSSVKISLNSIIFLPKIVVSIVKRKNASLYSSSSATI